MFSKNAFNVSNINKPMTAIEKVLLTAPNKPSPAYDSVLNAVPQNNSYASTQSNISVDNIKAAYQQQSILQDVYQPAPESIAADKQPNAKGFKINTRISEIQDGSNRYLMWLVIGGLVYYFVLRR